MSAVSVIEDYLPIGAVGSEAAREKSLFRGHVWTLHQWWARRPLTACRAAIYGALVPAARFQKPDGQEPRETGLARADASKFLERLCQYPGSPDVLREAQRHILEAHSERLSHKPAHELSVDDITGGRDPRPRVLDPFAGGGSIPLEALRLGCEAYALDLNPVAHIIELCTLVYPQLYARPDTAQTGSGEASTWAGLGAEVKYWGEWVHARAKREISELYSAISDPQARTAMPTASQMGFVFDDPDRQSSARGWLTAAKSSGQLVPIAYLWTRTVRCKNRSCGATVPLVRQTWLCNRAGRYVALRMVAPPGERRVRFEVVEAPSERDLGFDPAGFSKGGNASCPFCGTVADIEYVKSEGWEARIGRQLLAVVCTRVGARGKAYLTAEEAAEVVPTDEAVANRIKQLCATAGLTEPDEPIANLPPDNRENSLGIRVRPFGLRRWADLFTPRQLLALLTFASCVREAYSEMCRRGYEHDRAKAVATYLATATDREAENSSSLCRWNATAEKMQGTFGRQALPMVWDFCEINPFGGSVGDWSSIIELQANAIEGAVQFAGLPAVVRRGSATALPWPEDFFDAVITDPPYYDNVPYADISDFFYVWLKRTIGHLYPEHFATELTPKKAEAIADTGRHRGDREKANRAYESMMAEAFAEAHRVLKPGGPLVVVYAHKTTLGWATLVDALRRSEFVVSEAWPLDTEMKSRLRGMDSAALATSIFLVARKRADSGVGSYEGQVRPELEQIVRERVEALWEMGVAGADLVIAAVGAGLRAFTRFARVEYANGEEVPAERFLAEVEGVVLETLLEKIFGVSPSGVAAIDGPSRFYVLWRYTYGAAELDAGEAIVFTYSQPVELDGPQGLSAGSRALVHKKQSKYRLLDFTERGRSDKLGLPDREGERAPLIDALHRILWLIEHEPRSLPRFLDEARPDSERLRLLAQALAGAGLKGKSEEDGRALITTTGPEQNALAKLTANWRSLIEQQLPTTFGPLFAAAN